MHSSLQRILQHIEHDGFEQEREIRDRMAWFALPPRHIYPIRTDTPYYTIFDRTFDAYYALHFQWFLIKNQFSGYSNDNWEQQHIKLTSRMLSSPLYTREQEIQKYFAIYPIAYNHFLCRGAEALHRMIAIIGENMLNESLTQYFKLMVTCAWGFSPQEKDNSSLSGTWDERAKHVRSYKNKYEEYLPATYFTESDHISASYFETILNHHFIVSRRKKGITPGLEPKNLELSFLKHPFISCH